MNTDACNWLVNMLVEPRWIWKNNSDSNTWGIFTHTNDPKQLVIEAQWPKKYESHVGSFSQLAWNIDNVWNHQQTFSSEHFTTKMGPKQWLQHCVVAQQTWAPTTGPHVVLTQKSCQFFNVAALALQKKTRIVWANDPMYVSALKLKKRLNGIPTTL